MEGTIIIESSGRPESLKQRLEMLIYPTLSTGPPGRIQVVCKEKDRPRAISFLRRYYQGVKLSVFPGKPGESAGSGLLNKIRSEKVAFFPEGSAVCFPCWEAVDRVPGSMIPLVGNVQYPPGTAWIRQQNADGWLCRTRTAVKHLAASGSLEEWRAAEIFKNGNIPVLSPPPLTPPGETRPELVSKRENHPVITSQSRVMAIVPHYKCEEWLFQCLESLVNQTRPPDAVVVVDDNSPQPPVDMVTRFPRVTLLTAAENVGPYRIIQQVMDHSDFDAYLFQDADDWSTVDRLELLLKEAERTGAQLVGCQELRIICPTALANTQPLQMQPVCYPLDVNRALEEKPGHALHHPTSMVSRNLVERIGGFATGLRFGGDTEFLWRAVHLAPMVNIPRFCYFRRHRQGSLTTGARTGLSSPGRKQLLVLLKKRARENIAKRKNLQPLMLQPLTQRPPVELIHLCGPRVLS